jgi:two-component system, chemotaxis family, sensor kinase CheA
VLERGESLSEEAHGELIRALHTLKGNSAMLGLGPLRDAVHAVETVFREKRGRWPRPWLDRLFATAAALREAVERAGGEEEARAITALQEEVGGLERASAAAEQEQPPSLESDADAAPATSEAATTAQEPSTGTPAPDTGAELVRVPFRALDDLLDHAGELVGLAASFEDLLDSHRAELAATGVQLPLRGHLDILERISAQLRSTVMDLRLVPASRVFRRFPTLVRDIARAEEKEVRLELSGEETEIDKSTADALAEPLLHLVQNAVTHGIESPEERRRAGKDAAGTVWITASSRGDRVVLRVEDDGRGLDHDAIARRAAELGIIASEDAGRLDPAEIEALIFRPGFTTRTEADSVAGRGVGLDVVQRTVADLRGQLTVEKRPGGGTRFILSLPLTLAIMGAVLFEDEDEPFAIPTADVEETLRQVPVESASGAAVIRYRDEVVPLVRLGRLFGWREGGPPQPEERLPFVLVLRIGRRKVAVGADRMLEEKNVVVKGLPRVLGSLPAVSGATLLPGGRPALLLDPAGLASLNLDVHRRRTRGE